MKPDNPECVGCGHTAYHHRLDDAQNVSPNDPAALFRCIWPGPEKQPQLCTCPDFAVPADASWPYNETPE